MADEKTSTVVDNNPGIRPVQAGMGSSRSAVGPPSTSVKLPRPEQVRAFTAAFVKAPLEAVATIVQNAHGQAVTAEEGAAILLPYLIKASYAQQNLVVGALEQIAKPEQILNAALALYDQTQDPRILSTADQLLANHGDVSWPALRGLCQRATAECRFFVRTIAEMEGVSAEERRDVLMLLARNPDLDTRREVLSLLDGGVLSEQLADWQVLAEDPNEEIATLAADRLAALGS